MSNYKTDHDIIRNGRNDKDIMEFLYGSVAEYFVAYHERKAKEPKLTSTEFIEKSIKAFMIVYYENNPDHKPPEKPKKAVKLESVRKPEPVIESDIDGFPLF